MGKMSKCRFKRLKTGGKHCIGQVIKMAHPLTWQRYEGSRAMTPALYKDKKKVVKKHYNVKKLYT